MNSPEITGSAMPPTLQQLGIDKLSFEDRLELANALWDNVHSEMDADTEISPELKAELERRLALADADPSRRIPWEDVLEEMKARWS